MPKLLVTMPKQSPPEQKPATNFRRLFELCGVSFRPGNSVQAHADECPFCDGLKFHVNLEEGTYKCFSENKCGASGNHYTLIRRWYDGFLSATTDEDYQQLKAKRDLPLQTLKRHGLAWDGRCWLLPFKSAKGEVVNVQRYFPDSGDKFSLPALPLRIYGLDQLSNDATKTLFVCEGAFDAIALDFHFRSKKTRDRYDILALPSANTGGKECVQHFKDRTVRLCLDNDEAGRKGQERIAQLCREQKIFCKLSALKWPEVAPSGCDIADLVRDGENIAEFTAKHCLNVTAGGRRILFVRGDAIQDEKASWLWAGHVPFGQFCSLSGYMGTGKSLLVRDLAARGTAGKPMPNSEEALPPFTVLYFTSEDSAARVKELVELHGGKLANLFVHDIASGPEKPIDVLECLKEIESEINTRQVRLVILDALNSFVGGDISTDSNARRTLSGRLQSLARRTGACIIGVRNWGRAEGGTASQKALGATSLSDVARCVMNTQEAKNDKGKRTGYLLEFEKVSDAPRPESIPYHVIDRSTGKEDSYRREIRWAKPLKEQAADLVASLNRRAGIPLEKVAKKGSGSAPSHLAVDGSSTNGQVKRNI